MVPIIPLSFELKMESPNLAMKTLVIWIKALYYLLESFYENIFSWIPYPRSMHLEKQKVL